MLKGLDCKGVISAWGRETRLHPLTPATLLYLYSLTTLMLAGIR